ncbi:MAG: hypothetical protein KKH77_00345, partial [Candidatus Omnitrophica bacterium]|nr:hypothetical protein [Candidatus Omnitrophota bacterium]MBU1808221.1 hypothetical protein [Candidatus Omnitrophota bacterium]
STCKVRYLPAREFEDIIKKTISDISKNKKLLDECIAAANMDASSGLAPLLKKQKKYQKEINNLSKQIKNLVEGMKRGIMSRDVQEEHNRLVEERDRLQLSKDKISVEVEMKQNKLLNIDIIQKGLQKFDKVIDTLPLEDQKELMQLLIKEIIVYPFDPEKEQISKNEKDTFKIKIRTKRLKVKMKLYAMPNISIGCESSPNSSYSSKDGCPARIRT